MANTAVVACRQGRRCFEAPDVVLYDELADRALLEFDVGKKTGAHCAEQRGIEALLIARARAGRTVVPLKAATCRRQVAPIALLAERESFAAPAVIVVGEVVRYREQLDWFAPMIDRRRSAVIARDTELDRAGCDPLNSRGVPKK